MKLLNSEFFIVFSIILFGLIVRLININQPLLEFFPQRQTQTAEITRNIYKNGWADFWIPKVRYFTGQPTPYVLEFPLYNGIVASLYSLFGPNVIWGRIVSLFLFILSGIILYRLVKSITNNQLITIFALLFFVFSPLHILISRSFQPEELALFLLLLAVYRQSWLFLSIAALTKMPVILFTPLIMYENRRSGNTWFKILFQFFLAVIPVFLWSVRARELTVYSPSAFELKTWFRPNLFFNPQWYASIFQIEQTMVLSAIGLMFFWVGFWQKFNTKLKLWNLWLLCGAAYTVTFNNHIMVHEYYHIFLIPVLSIFIAFGLNSVWNINLDTKKYIQPIFRAGIILIFITGLLLPAFKRILSSPKSPNESVEINSERYNYIIDF